MFLIWKRNYCRLVPLLHTDLCYRQVIIHFAEQFAGIRIFFPVPLSSVSYMAVLSYLLPVVSCLLLGKVQSVSPLSLLTRGALPSDSTVWNARGSTASFVTAVSNLPDLPTLHFPGLSEGPRTPEWIHKLMHAGPLRGTADQLHLKPSAVPGADEARCALSLPKEQEVPRDSSSRADLGCFKAHVLAHSSTKSTLIYDLQLLIHLSAPCSETLLSQKMLVLLITQGVDTALAAISFICGLWPTMPAPSLWPGSCLGRGPPLENSHANLQSQI